MSSIETGTTVRVRVLVMPAFFRTFCGWVARFVDEDVDLHATTMCELLERVDGASATDGLPARPPREAEELLRVWQNARPIGAMAAGAAELRFAIVSERPS